MRFGGPPKYLRDSQVLELIGLSSYRGRALSGLSKALASSLQLFGPSFMSVERIVLKQLPGDGRRVFGRFRILGPDVVRYCPPIVGGKLSLKFLWRPYFSRFIRAAI